jgi:hypothetical protein
MLHFCPDDPMSTWKAISLVLLVLVVCRAAKIRQTDKNLSIDIVDCRLSIELRNCVVGSSFQTESDDRQNEFSVRTFNRY